MLSRLVPLCSLNVHSIDISLYSPHNTHIYYSYVGIAHALWFEFKNYTFKIIISYSYLNFANTRFKLHWKIYITLIIENTSNDANTRILHDLQHYVYIYTHSQSSVKFVSKECVFICAVLASIWNKLWLIERFNYSN